MIVVYPDRPGSGFSNLQAVIDAYPIVLLKKGVYNWPQILTIRQNHILIGEGQETILNVPGVVIEPNSGSYAAVTLGNMRIQGAGSGTGLYVNRGRVRVEDLTIHNFDIGLNIQYAIGSRYERVTSSVARIGLLVAGDISTTLTFAGCVFDQCSEYAADVQAEVNSVSFTDNTYFQSSKRGIRLNNAGVVTLHTCYWENIEEENIIAGDVGAVQSLAIINPIMIGGNANNTDTNAVELDDVKTTFWLHGDCRLPKANLIATTADTGTVIYYEPRNLGIGNDFNNLEFVQQHLDNGRFLVQRIQFNNEYGGYLLSSGFNQAEDDMTLLSLDGNNIVYNIRNDGSMRIRDMYLYDTGTAAYRKINLINGVISVT